MSVAGDDSAIVITGTARHSLGEALARACQQRFPAQKLITIDKAANEFLIGPRFVQITCDLNALHHASGLDGLGEFLAGQLAAAAPSAGISHLIHCAGVYANGPFLSLGTETRSAILGVNVVGMTEVLFRVMQLNASCARSNSQDFTFLMIGSMQGLRARARRSIYAPSKAFGIDMCSSLSEGLEVLKCIYAALGPVDTPMFHRNYWVSKAGGSLSVFEALLAGSRETYRKVLVECDASTLNAWARSNRECDETSVRATLGRYEEQRKQAQSSFQGLTSAELCAEALCNVIADESIHSGIASLTSPRSHSVRLKVWPFQAVDRLRLVDANDIK